MSILNPTKNDFRTHEEYEQYKQRMKELEETEMTHNIQMINHLRNQGESPCKLFYQLRKDIPLSVFLNVYPFNELVDCGSGFDLSELTELKRLYSIFNENDQQRYIDSFRNLEQFILESKYPPVPMFSSEPSTSATPVAAAYSTQPKRSYNDFQSSNERVQANTELRNIIHNPTPSQREIDEIQYQNYMQNRIPSSSELPQPQPQPQPQPPSLIGRVKGFFGFGGKKRKTIKLIKNSRSRSKSRSKLHHRRYKKSRSYSRSKK
jgi:hypothetical protein